jgi:hypothetical protein
VRAQPAPDTQAIPDWRADLEAAAPHLFAPAAGEDTPSVPALRPVAPAGPTAVDVWVRHHSAGDDAVVLVDVLDRVEDPAGALRQAAAQAGPVGKLIVTVPLGPSFDRHEQRVFYPASLLTLLVEHAVPAVLEVVEGYLCAVALPGDLDDAPAAAERLLLAVQPALEDALHAAHREQALADGLRADLDGLRQRSDHLQARAEDAETRLNRFREQRETLRERLAQRDERIRRQKDRENRLRARSKAYRTNLSRAERQRDQWKASYEKERWRVESLQARRWWRLGELLRSAMTPKGLVRFPKGLVEVLIKPYPRPKPPGSEDAA